MSGGTDEGTLERKRSFLDALASTGSVTEAADIAGVHRRTAYKWKDTDKLFSTEWDTAYQLGLDALEDEATRRARAGWEEPVWYKGEMVGSVRKFSDTLLMFMLNAGRPAKFRKSKDDDGDGTGTAVLISGGLPIADA